jgi:type III pantothenate kinase
MNLLTIDVGNSRCKFCFGNMDEPMPIDLLAAIELDEIEERFSAFASFDQCVISSVNSEASGRIRRILAQKVTANQLVFLNSKNSPLSLLIDSPETLGADRLAAAFAAFKRANGAAIVVDSGTAVTVDRINAGGGFEGGSIFPGVELAFQSLANHTDKLPRVALEPGLTPHTFGNDTKSALQSGVFWSQVGAIERIVSNYRNELGDVPVYFTGGVGKPMCGATELEGQFVEQLVLEGLWEFGRIRTLQT